MRACVRACVRPFAPVCFPPELIDVLRGAKLLVSVMVVMETLPGVTDVIVADQDMVNHKGDVRICGETLAKKR